MARGAWSPAGLILFTACSVNGTVGIVQRDAARDGDVPSIAAGCGLNSAALCEGFSRPLPGGRAGDLDEALWSVARITSQTNPPQGLLGAWPPVSSRLCGTQRDAIVPDGDYIICDGNGVGMHLTQTFHNGSGSAYHSLRPRQRFDFSGRMGTIAFDLGGRIRTGHGWWPELWIVDQLIPAPHRTTFAVNAVPRNGIGIEFAGQSTCPGGAGLTETHVSSIVIYANGQQSQEFVGDELQHGTACYPVSDELLNHYEVRISSSSIEVWVSDPGGAASTFRPVAWVRGLSLPITAGYVHFQHSQVGSQPAAEDFHTFHWDNLGFDGPVLPLPRTYEVPNSLQPVDNASFPTGSINTGYAATTDMPAVFTFNNVDLTGMRRATLNFNVTGLFTTMPLQVRINGGNWLQFPIDTMAGGWLASQIELPMSALQMGSNRVEIADSDPSLAFAIFANIDLTLEAIP